jgi:monoamine oxidase
MSQDDLQVVIAGGGAAGIAAARTLAGAGVKALIVEARDRLGGRAWTVATDHGFPVDLGCGWLHSADRNPWRAIAEAKGWAIDHAPPPWMRAQAPRGELPAGQRDFGQAIWEFRERVEAFPESGPDLPASSFVAPDSPWRGMLDAVSTFYSGAELDRVSACDLARYGDTAINWRVVRGYGALIADHAAGLDVRLSTAVTKIDRRGKRVKVQTTAGTLAADFVIVTLPTNVLAAAPDLFLPALPEKAAAAAGLPLGLADKLYLALDGPEDFRSESRAFGRPGQVATAAYHFRPQGRPVVEAYFGGETARQLEADGQDAFVDFAVEELVHAVGSDMAGRVKPLAFHAWGSDPLALGSYSYAVPGHADDRARLAEAVEDRIFFAGEACSTADYSTAHGAAITGVKAAADILEQLA